MRLNAMLGLAPYLLWLGFCAGERDTGISTLASLPLAPAAVGCFPQKSVA